MKCKMQDYLSWTRRDQHVVEQAASKRQKPSSADEAEPSDRDETMLEENGAIEGTAAAERAEENGEGAAEGSRDAVLQEPSQVKEAWKHNDALHALIPHPCCVHAQFHLNRMRSKSTSL